MSTKIYAPLVVVEVEAKTFEVGLLYAKDVGIWVCMLFVKIFGDKIIEQLINLLAKHTLDIIDFST